MDASLIRYLTQHPLNRRMQLRNLPGIARWYLASRLLHGAAVIVPFVNRSKLIAIPGRWGSEANVLCGLHEFADMGFLLHILRPGDLFCDVGANVGTYTILASSAIGARSMAFEPIEATYTDLVANIAVNGISDLAMACRLAIGSKPGQLNLTNAHDTTNHVELNDQVGGLQSVEVDSLDRRLAGEAPVLLKIDVEGWESETLAGGEATLNDHRLKAVILELNGSGHRYGFSDEDTHRLMLSAGFEPFGYAPFERRLFELGGIRRKSGNTLYLRDLEAVRARLEAAPPFHVRHFLHLMALGPRWIGRANRATRVRCGRRLSAEQNAVK